MANFDFDHWQTLSQRDPAAYFRARALVIARFINAQPHSERLWQLQERIDSLRACAGSPLAATRLMMGLLGDCLDELVDRVGELEREARSLDHTAV